MIYFWVETTAAASEDTSSLAEPPWKKRKSNPSPPLTFLSLPDVLILNCLSRLSKSYYPKLSLVSKNFRSLVSSIDLNHARFHHKTQEPFFYVCLKFPDRPHPTWYTLWIKPENFDKEEDKKKKSTLVQVPSSYASEPLLIFNVGLDVYAFRQRYPPSRTMLVRKKDACFWRCAPNMSVARANHVACLFDEKIYVMGGCGENDTWGEVFDTKTQTWGPLPDPPSPELRFSTMIRGIQIFHGKFYVMSNESKDSVYDPKEGKWNAAAKLEIGSKCVVDNVWYSCRPNSFMWYDKECSDWRVVKGLSSLNQSRRSGLMETVNFNGKLLLLWDKSTKPRRRNCEEKNICGALIAFERRKNGQVWGKVQWSNVMLKVPSSYRFLRSTSILT